MCSRRHAKASCLGGFILLCISLIAFALSNFQLLCGSDGCIVAISLLLVSMVVNLAFWCAITTDVTSYSAPSMMSMISSTTIGTLPVVEIADSVSTVSVSEDHSVTALR